MRTRKPLAVLAAVAIIGLTFGLSACQAEPEPVVVAPTPVVTPEPAPEPEPQPGAGPACPTEHCVTLTMTGDMLFHPGLWRPFQIPTTEDGRNYDLYPLLEGQKPYLDRSDIAVCHQETPLGVLGGEYTGYPVFNTPPELALASAQLGYDVCTTASNHTIDMGTEGLNRTLDTLEANGLKHTGSYRTPEEAEEILIVEANGAKVAFISATFSLNGYEAEADWQVDYPLAPERAIERAQRARDLGADIVIGVQHAGTEYSTVPDVQQMGNARQLVDSGLFDFVYNHHTHSVQPIEMYNGKWIAYGTGNGISESAPFENRVNNEFLLLRLQFAQQIDGTWAANDLAWAPATNTQNGGYKWCSVASDAPQGVCESPEFDADVRERTRATVNSMGALDSGVHELLLSQDPALPVSVPAE
jgi:hypothetical protein